MTDKLYYYAPRNRTILSHAPRGTGRGPEIELPLVLLFLADLTARRDPRPLAERAPVTIDAGSFDRVFGEHELALAFDVADRRPGKEGASIGVSLRFGSLADMEPSGLAVQVPELREILVRRGALGADPGARDEAAAIDAIVSRQVSEILHHPKMRALESVWRGIKLVVDGIDASKNIVVEVLSCSKDDLFDDLEEAATPADSALYEILHGGDDGARRSRPVAAVLGVYELGPMPADVSFLRLCAAVTSLVHAPFVAAAGIHFFGVKHLGELPSVDAVAYQERNFFTNFGGFRAKELARHAALLTPRVLLRPLHPTEIAPEDPAARCWGSPVFAFALRLADAFARHGFCVDIVGPEGGRVGLPVEAAASEEVARGLAAKGLNCAVKRPDAGDAYFATATSVHAQTVSESDAPPDPVAEGERRCSELPWLLLVSRFVHYLEFVHHVDKLASRPREEVERELDDWLSYHVADGDVVSPIIAARRPLRRGRVTVTEPEGGSPFRVLTVELRPHYRPSRAFFALRLSTRIPKA